MKSYLLEISGQSLKEYIWPDVSTSLGHKTAIYEGAIVSLALALIYSLITLKLFIFGASLPEELNELMETGLFDPNLYTSIKILLNLLAAGSALYYIRSIGLKKSKLSIVFLFLWTFLEVLFEYQNGFTIMLIIYLILFIGSLNAYRTIR